MAENTPNLVVEFFCRRFESSIEESDYQELTLSSTQELEEIKKQNKIHKPEGEAIPILLLIENHSPYSATSIRLKIKSILTAPSKDQYSLEINPDGLSVDKWQRLVINLFDLSGFDNSLTKLEDMDYVANGTLSSSHTIRSPYLVETKELMNEFNGFRNKKDLEAWYLLNNYITGGLHARRILLELMFTISEKVANDTIDPTIYPVESFQDKETFLQSTQIDIISKIMIYIEDLITVLISIKDSTGYYYDFLDKKNPDLGDMITKFLNTLESLTDKDFRRMLSYVDENETIDDSKQLEIINKIINININEVKSLLFDVMTFRRSHQQVFRRFKHAGFAFKLNTQSPNYFDNNKYDSFFMVYHKEIEPFQNALPIPFSPDVLESYKHLITYLEKLISDVIQSKLGCIVRRIDKVLPINCYSLDKLNEDEINQYNLILKQFFEGRPIHGFNSVFKWKSTVSKEDIGWYLNIGNYLKRSKMDEKDV